MQKRSTPILPETTLRVVRRLFQGERRNPGAVFSFQATKPGSTSTPSIRGLHHLTESSERKPCVSIFRHSSRLRSRTPRTEKGTHVQPTTHPLSVLLLDTSKSSEWLYSDPSPHLSTSTAGGFKATVSRSVTEPLADSGLPHHLLQCELITSYSLTQSVVRDRGRRYGRRNR